MSSMPLWERTSVITRRAFPNHMPTVRNMLGSFCGPTTRSATVAISTSSPNETPNT
jgi:hypothetical protein